MPSVTRSQEAAVRGSASTVFARQENAVLAQEMAGIPPSRLRSPNSRLHARSTTGAQTKRQSHGALSLWLKISDEQTVSVGFSTAADEIVQLCCMIIFDAVCAEPASLENPESMEETVGRAATPRCGALSFAAWNPAGLSHRLLGYIDSLNHHVVCLSEIHGQHLEYESNRHFCCGPVSEADS